MNILEKDKKYVWHPYSHLTRTKDMVHITKGEGVFLIDEKGNKYIDAISSWWVNLFGHTHPYIGEKLIEQYKKLEHCIFAQFTHEPAVRLAEKLLKFCGLSNGKVFFSDNGSTAVEVALKIAIQYNSLLNQKKSKIVMLENAYHGDTFGAMSVSGKSAFTLPFDEYLFEVDVIPTPNETNIGQSIDYFRKNKDNISCFIYEPVVQGVAGMNIYSASALGNLLSELKSLDIITIADEIMTGFYRTGEKLASIHTGVNADIICLSKGLTGGTMAMGVTVISPFLCEPFMKNDAHATFFHGHSYTANPLACSAALSTFDLLPSFLDAVHNIGMKHQEMLPVLENFDYFENIRSIGTILALDVKNNGQAGYFNHIRDALYVYFLKKGILLRPLGNVLYILPPYCISDEQLDYVYDSIIGLDYYNLNNKC